MSGYILRWIPTKKYCVVNMLFELILIFVDPRVWFN